MDIKAGLVGAGAVVLLGAGIFGASAWANDTSAPAPVVVVEPTVAVEKVAPPAVVVPETVVTPEPVVVAEPAPEVVVVEPAAPAPVEPEPVEPAPAPAPVPTVGTLDPNPVVGPGNSSGDNGSRD